VKWADPAWTMADIANASHGVNPTWRAIMP